MNIPSTITTTKLTAGFAVGLILSALPASATLLLDYNFNPDSSTQTSSGSLSDPITYQGAGAVGADGSGVSGLAGDRAFDNSAADGMGGNATTGYTGVAGNATTSIGSLSSLTLTGWFKADEVIGNGAYILNTEEFKLRAYDVAFPSTTGVLQLTIGGVASPRSTTVNSDYTNVGSWVFFAVVWDGANISFYDGTTANEVAQLGTTQAYAPTMGTVEDDYLYVGNITDAASITNPGFARVFDGQLDNIRVYDEALNLSSLQTIRANDMANVPEPSNTAVLLALGVLGLIGWRKHR